MECNSETVIWNESPWDIVTRSRLLSLLLIVLVGVGSAANQVDGASLGVNPLQDVTIDIYKHFFNSNVSKTVEETGTHIRKHLLYNLCSERIVKIIRKGRKGINARGKKKGKNMNLSKLIFESTPSGTIKIFGQHTGLHICFNRKGRLRAKTDDKKSLLCQFKEEYSDDKTYTHYRTADTTKAWYLGFKKNGRPLKGTDRYIKNEDCFKFQKLRPNRTSETPPKCPPGTGSGPEGVNFCDNYILNFLKAGTNKVRHDSKHHKRRGKG